MTPEQQTYEKLTIHRFCCICKFAIANLHCKIVNLQKSYKLKYQVEFLQQKISLPNCRGLDQVWVNRFVISAANLKFVKKMFNRFNIIFLNYENLDKTLPKIIAAHLGLFMSHHYTATHGLKNTIYIYIYMQQVCTFICVHCFIRC